MAQDYYELLGINRNASDDDIKKAYRKQAMKYHPDRNQGDKEAEKKFKEISQAYDVLKDSQKRAAYDRYGHQAFENGGFGAGGGGNQQGGFGFDFSSNFADFFEEMFSDMGGGARNTRQTFRGSDIRYDLSITLEESYKGINSNIRYTTAVQCDQCKGAGSENGAAPINCRTCKGKGKIRTQQGFFTIERTCPSCQGLGQTIDKPCRKCYGAGHARKEKSLDVKIPAGVDEGTRIRLSNEGEAGLRGGSNGDLYLFISIKPHKFFKRQHQDLYCQVPISMVTAALGGEIEVPTIDGTAALVKIPEGTQNRHQFRLKSKGMTAVRSSKRGDMYIEVLVETPVNLSKKQRELLEQFKKADKDNSTSPQSTGFFAKVKEFFDDLKKGA